MIKISVVIPSFNQGKYIRETLESVFNQDYPAHEIIVIDGGSTDETVSILKDLNNKITFWLSEKDNGQSHAINKGFERCTGDVICWLCSDDFFEQGALGKVVRCFEKLDEKTGLIHGDTLLFDHKGIITRDNGYAEISNERLLAGMAFPQPSVFFRKALLERVGKLNESLHYGMDYDLFARMSVCSGFVHLPEVLSRYRLHESSKTISAATGFINDWKNVFFSIVNGFDLNEINKTLELLDINASAIPETVDFFEANSKNKTVDSRLLSYYFLSSLMRLEYNAGGFSSARKTGKFLRASFSDLLSKEPAVSTIAFRSQCPTFFICFMRKLSSIFRTR